MTDVLADIHVIDVDSHITEPPDVWTSRLETKWGRDLIPHVETDPETGDTVWVVGGEKECVMGMTALAGYAEHYPKHPATYDDIADAGAYDAKVRLARLDEMGVSAQVFYPNVGGFGSGAFARLDAEMALDCVRAYNDFAVEWASADARRLLPLMAVPLWDVHEAVNEIDRAHRLGHRGVIMSSQPEHFGAPMLADPAWNPLWAAAQERSLPVNFHIGSGSRKDRPKVYEANGNHANMAKQTVMFTLGNANAITEIIFSGICQRFPNLNFVSVESGVSWLPYILEAMDWQWRNGGVHLEHPDYELLPSEYFRRQVYSCFWFETGIDEAVIAQVGADNIMYETDYPHPTSMTPGPASIAVSPNQFINDNYATLPEDVLRKLVQDNAARVYNIDVAALR
jgi:uncharacterized protein